MSVPAWLAAFLIWSAASMAMGHSFRQDAPVEDSGYLSWSEKQCTMIGQSTRVNGRVGGFLDTRIVGTERSYNYKLRATWLTSEVVRAVARLKQLQLGLSDQETVALVTEAESAGDTVIMVEIDPREGSGVIPREWVAFLRRKASHDEDLGVRGINRPELRAVKALSGIKVRDYAYDIFWLVFPLVNDDGQALLPEDATEAELVVRIYNKEGRVTWPIPASIRNKMNELVRSNDGEH